ncbi:unnamed protein product [Medioppia subpectinata]|uniref:Uncharacterized protein n=1 Tax=Medioppia subpectinata TaxID=1979941 RepID=A0A7R9QBK8_9ACAR|nr:unnamed protein product [Medioppia subpectinata]CAG2117956.1 unnamed protein product [Medioppia subpectinata]
MRLSAIIIFNSERPNIQQPELIKLQQYIYMHLLKRYFYMRYQSESEAKVRLLRLMDSLHKIRLLSDIHATNYYVHRPTHVGPILQEVFNR